MIKITDLSATLLLYQVMIESCTRILNFDGFQHGFIENVGYLKSQNPELSFEKHFNAPSCPSAGGGTPAIRGRSPGSAGGAAGGAAGHARLCTVLK